MIKRSILFFLMAILCVGFLKAQDEDFNKFIACFPDKQLPYGKNNFTKDTTRLIPDELAFKYLCGNDSSLLTFEIVGMNQETLEVKYRNSKPFEYRAFAKAQDEDYYIFVYDGFTDDGYHEFTTVLKVGLFNKNGQFLDEMLFYVFDDTGKLKEQTGQLTTDLKVQILQKEYIKNEKGRYTSSYYKIMTSFDIDSTTNKFKEISTNKELIDKSKN